MPRTPVTSLGPCCWAALASSTARTCWSRRSAAGTGGLLWVRGEAGIGKSSVLTEIGDRARRAGATVLRGTAADEATGAPAFWLWTQVLRQAGTGDPQALVALGGPRARRAAELVDPDPSGDSDPQPANRFPLFDGVLAVLDGLTDRVPGRAAARRPALGGRRQPAPGAVPAAEPGRPARVLVVCGWRDHEVPAGSDRDLLAAEIAAAGESWPLAGLGPEPTSRP